MRVAVLENDVLRATVALDLGGRVLSLFDRRADRELLYVNPVVQPANLALRNAWFSGGIEWNIGTRGHSPTTMDTLHAAMVEGPGGEPVLRLWEWERIRGVVFQVDLWLPSSSAGAARPDADPQRQRHGRRRCTGGRTRRSPSGRHAGARPGDPGLPHRVPERAARRRRPDDGDGDVTFPARQRQAADFFYDIAPQQRPWIAAIDGDGAGAAQVSTAACAAASCSCGAPAPAVSAGSGGCPTVATSGTPRSRPAWRRPSSST